METETKRVGPGMARDVFVKVKALVLDGWTIYGWAGPIRIGCDHDEIEVYLVRPKQPAICKSLMPQIPDLDSREA